MTTFSVRMVAWAFACGLLSGTAAAVPAVKLNDTGADQCRDDSGGWSSACAGTAQDGEAGRDVTANVATDGRVGFSFAKVCNNGAVGGSAGCPTSATLGTSLRDWACTKDLRTGLVWEVKTLDGGLRDSRMSYTQLSDGSATSAAAYVAAVNAKGLCGSKNWRLPSRVELQGLVDYGVAAPGTTIDLTWFPNTYAGPHWTSDAYQLDASFNWSVGFHGGYMSYRPRGALGAVRLVRGTKVL